MPANYEALLHDIRQRIDYESFFREFLPDMRRNGGGGEYRAKCIWHDDSDPSLSVNVEDGVYLCRVPSCGARGDFLTFYQRRTNTTFAEAVRAIARIVGLSAEDYDTRTRPRVDPSTIDEEAVIASYRAPERQDARRDDDVPPSYIDEAIVTSSYERLIADASHLEFLATRRGLTRETVERFQLGHDGQRYYIPIRDAEGRVVNIRRYKPGARSHEKMISWRQGFGTARLFPLSALDFTGSVDDAAPVCLFEGEMDTMLAVQLGLCAITTTGGAGTWRDQWNQHFRGRRVIICYDVDDAGRAGALNIARALSGTAREIFIIHLPLAEPAGADFTDFIVGHGHTVDDFLRLVRTATPFRPEQADGVDRPSEEPSRVHLSAASRAEYYNRPVQIAVMVSGKTTAPYIAPKEVRMTCPDPRLKMCEHCPVMRRQGALTREMEYDNNEVLQFINIPEDQLQRKLKQKVGVPQKCSLVNAELTDTLNVEELQVIPEIERTEEDTPYVTRAVYYVGHGLRANKNYLMTGITVPEPKKQLATHLIFDAVPAQSNIDAFMLTDETKDRLRAFQPPTSTVAGLWDHLNMIYADLERFTRIYQRRDLMLGVDMTFHSPITFVFQGEQLVRGWVEALVIGDSRTGKTTIVQRLLDHYGAGEFSSGENTTLAGLVGGLHQVGTSWALQWGRIPLNDRRLIVIDEAGNLPPEQIARMSSMRSSGIAEIVKVHTERTNARTRQIWISNPRSPRPLSSFSQGVLAVKELIGAPEDIARFDLVVTAAASDVSLATINAAREAQAPEIFTSELCHQRVMWAWSRRSNQISFTREAVSALLARATEQGEKYRYTTEIPLVEPNEQRVKLARLAVSVATMFYSTDETGENIVVRAEHVDFAFEFLERLYAKPSLSFAEYARMSSRRYEITDEERVAGIMRRSPNAVRAMMEQEQFTQRDLAEVLGYEERDGLREAIGVLRDAGFLRRVGSSFYVKTSGAIAFLRRELSRESGMGDEAFAPVAAPAVEMASDGELPPW